MEKNLLSYLLEASVALAVLYAVYELLLKQSLHFRFSRAFILAALGLSAVLPWVELPVQQTLIPAMPGFVLSEATISPTAQADKSFWNSFTIPRVLKLVYGCGAAVLAVRLLLQLLNLWRWKQRLPSEPNADYRLIRTGGALPTFSFFRWLFWDDTQPLTEPEKNLVLAHEQTHMRQWHSADVLVLEFFKILFWFHPAVYAFQKAQRAVHEYLADQAAIRHSSQEIYLKLLTHSLLKKLTIQLAQSFYQSPLKNRMKMLHLSQTARPTVWKAVASLVLMSLVAIVFACSEKMAAVNPENIFVSGFIADSEGKPLPGAHVVVKGTHTGTTTNASGGFTLKDISANSVLVASFVGFKTQEFTARNKEAKIRMVLDDGAGLTSMIPPPPPPLPTDESFVVVEEMPQYPGGMEAMFKHLSDNIKYPEKSVKEGVYGKVFVTFVVREDGSLTNVEVAKGVNEEINAEALRVVKLMPKWIPGKQSGKTVPVKYNLPIAFAL